MWLYLNSIINLSISNQNCFHVMSQTVFTSHFEIASFVHFKYHYRFWHFVNIFRLGIKNSKNFQVCFKNILNENMKLFSQFSTQRPQLSCQHLSLHEFFLKIPPLSKQIPPSPTKNECPATENWTLHQMKSEAPFLE